MTTLEIKPRWADKTARFRGTVAAGEHVAVTIKGGAEWLGDDNGAHLSLRVIDFVTGRTLALFPRPPETLGDDDEPDAWSVSAEDPDDLFCNLNLNTDRMVNAARHMLRVPVLFVMGAKDDENPAATRTLYFRDRYGVEFWPERVGDDTPYDLDKWPKQINEWTELVAEFGDRLTTAETNISQAKDRVNAAIDAIPQTVETAVTQSNSGKADKVANATSGNLAALGANGNLNDSGKKPADFADAAQFAAHKDNTTIHITATERSTWNAKYDKPSGGIPKSDLAAAVQTSLGKADSAIQEHQSLAAYVNGGVYDGDAKKILLKHDSVTVAEIDATAFIKDGMVDSVEISGGNLVISFNTDAGVEDIEIPLTDIFNPSNYYDKTAADGRFVQKEAGKGLSSNDYTTSEKQKLEGIEADANKTVVDSSLSPNSTNPVQNKVVTAALDGKLTRAEAEAGFTDWVWGDGVNRGQPEWDAENNRWSIDLGAYVSHSAVSSEDDVVLPTLYSIEEDEPMPWTATRTRLPTWTDVNGKQNKSSAVTPPPVPINPDAGYYDTIDYWLYLVYTNANNAPWPSLNINNGNTRTMLPSAELLWAAYKMLIAKIPYALVTVTPTAGAPFVRAACFPIKYTEGGSTVEIAADDANIGIIDDAGNGYVIEYNAVTIFFCSTEGIYTDSVVDDLTFGANEDTPDSSTQVLGFTQTATLADRAVNLVTLGSGVESAVFRFPEKTNGKARDFMLRLVITGSTVPEIGFVESDGTTEVAFDADDDDSWADIEQGVNLLMFTDTQEASA